MLWALGSIGHAVAPLAGLDITGGLIKIPPILADAANAWLLFVIARRFLGRWVGDDACEWIGVVAAVLYLFNPGFLTFDSAVWGQVDSVVFGAARHRLRAPARLDRGGGGGCRFRRCW